MQENNEQLRDSIKKFITEAVAESYRRLDERITKQITGATGRILKDQDRKLAEMRNQLKEELRSMLKNELKTELLALTPEKKAQAIQILTQTSTNKPLGITKTPGICGGDACIAGTHIPVWGLIESRRLGISEAQLLDDYPHISAADLVNAWAYADAHSEEIEEAIRKNQQA